MDKKAKPVNFLRFLARPSGRWCALPMGSSIAVDRVAEGSLATALRKPSIGAVAGSGFADRPLSWGDVPAAGAAPWEFRPDAVVT